MGSSRWDGARYAVYTSSLAGRSTEQVFESRGMSDDINPKDVAFREARDSVQNPRSFPIIIGLDVTGSMKRIPDYMVRTGLGTMVEEILARDGIADPAVCIMGIGDAAFDCAPLQVGQFESDIRINEWTQKLFLEGGGGGNRFESYDLPYYFAAHHTRTDAFEKRGQKGVLVTIGDEMPPPNTKAMHIERFIGGATVRGDIAFTRTVELAKRMYTPYHIIIAEGDYASRHSDSVRAAWQEILGQNAIVLADHTNIAELIVSILELESGKSLEEVVESWDGPVSTIIGESLRPDRRMDTPA